jgi:hypothetical protein
MGNGNSMQNRIKEWCDNNGEPDYEYYYERPICFKGNGILNTFNTAQVGGIPKVLDVNFKTYTEDCACNVYLILKANKNMLTFNAHLYIINDMGVKRYYNFLLNMTWNGFRIAGMSYKEEIFGELTEGFFNNNDGLILNLFAPGDHLQLMSPLEFKHTNVFERETGIIVQDSDYDSYNM